MADAYDDDGWLGRLASDDVDDLKSQDYGRTAASSPDRSSHPDSETPWTPAAAVVDGSAITAQWVIEALEAGLGHRSVDQVFTSNPQASARRPTVASRGSEARADRVEEQIGNVLLNAQRAAAEAIDAAERRGREIVAEAQIHAERIIEDARRRTKEVAFGSIPAGSSAGATGDFHDGAELLAILEEFGRANADLAKEIAAVIRSIRTEGLSNPL